MKPISKKMAEFLAKVGLPLDPKLVDAMAQELVRMEKEKQLVEKIQLDGMKRQESQKSRVVANAGKNIDPPIKFITPVYEKWMGWDEAKDDVNRNERLFGTFPSISSINEQRASVGLPKVPWSEEKGRSPITKPQAPEKKKPRIPRLDEKVKRKFSLDE